MMNLSAKITVPEHVLARQVGDETVILDLQNGHYYGLDLVGVRMWQLMTAGQTLSEVCDVIATEYDVPREVLERDVLELVRSLIDAKLISLTA
jgi:hypothetical protein